MTNLLPDVLVAGMATYSVSRALARELGPLGAFRGFRRWVAARRGYQPDDDGRWVRLAPSGIPGVTELEGIEADWLVAGITCPMCLARYVGPALMGLMLLGGPWRALVALLAAGGVSVALSARKGG